MYCYLNQVIDNMQLLVKINKDMPLLLPLLAMTYTKFVYAIIWAHDKDQFLSGSAMTWSLLFRNMIISVLLRWIIL